MKEDLIADIWTLIVEHIPEKTRSAVASDFVNAMLDHGVKESVLTSLIGMDSYLDDAINYAIDGEDTEEDADDYDYDDDEE